jgi:hypothetical protein
MVTSAPTAGKCVAQDRRRVFGQHQQDAETGRSGSQRHSQCLGGVGRRHHVGVQTDRLQRARRRGPDHGNPRGRRLDSQKPHALMECFNAIAAGECDQIIARK